jgi:hypothetical protein
VTVTSWVLDLSVTYVALKYYIVQGECIVAQHAFAISMAAITAQTSMDHGIYAVSISGDLTVNVRITRDM